MKSKPGIIQPLSGFKLSWDGFVAFCSVYTVVETPYRLAAGLPLTSTIIAVEVFLTVIFFIDCVFQFRTAVRIRDVLHTRRFIIRKRYLRTWFPVDAASILPLSLLPHPSGLPWILGFLVLVLQLNRMLRVFRIDHKGRRLIRLLPFQLGLSRLIFLIAWIVLIAHWAACGWLALGGSRHYIDAIYWSVTTMTTVGYGDVKPTSTELKLYAIFVMGLGVGVYGFIIGNMAALLSRLNAARVEHEEEMEALDAFLSRRKIPAELRKRIRDYNHYLVEHELFFDESRVFDRLPKSLSSEVAFLLHGAKVKRVSLFRDLSDAIVREIVMVLKPEVYIPGETIVRRGDFGHRMYFISRGKCRVLDGQDNIIATLGRGRFFGEIALLLDQPRMATVQTLTYCRLYTLDRASLRTVMERHPGIAEKLESIARERLKSSPA